MGHLPCSIVHEPKSSDCWECKGKAESVLGSGGGIRGRTATAVEDDEEDNKQDLVDELAPTLHEESHGDTATTMKSIFSRRQLAGCNSVLKRRGGSNGILAADSKAVEEEGPGIANDPAFEGEAPASGKHEQANEHDDGILNQAPTTADPVTNDTHEHLSHHDTDDLKISDAGEPIFAANLIFTPAFGPDLRKERF